MTPRQQLAAQRKTKRLSHARMVEREKGAGRVTRQYWCTPADHIKLRAFADKLREGV